MIDRKPLAGLRILVVEDQYLLAMEMQQVLAQLGATVSAMARDLSQARAAAAEAIDGAILDLSLVSERTDQFADELRAAGVPFIFATGFERACLPQHLQDSPWLEKPIHPAKLARLAVEVFGRPVASAAPETTRKK